MAIRVLFVEDNATVRRSLARRLRPEFELVEAANGREARALLAAGEQFDVVVTDLEMPHVKNRNALCDCSAG